MLKVVSQPLGTRSGALRTAVFLIAAISALIFSSGLWAVQPEISESGAKQLEVLANIKASRTESQQKIDSRLFMAILKQRQDPRLAALPDFRFVVPDADGKIEVDIQARGTNDVKAVVDRVRAAGGEVRTFQFRYRAVRARLPITAIEGVAAFAGVRKVDLATERVHARHQHLRGRRGAPGGGGAQLLRRQRRGLQDLRPLRRRRLPGRLAGERRPAGRRRPAGPGRFRERRHGDAGDRA